VTIYRVDKDDQTTDASELLGCPVGRLTNDDQLDAHLREQHEALCQTCFGDAMGGCDACNGTGWRTDATEAKP